MCRAAGGWLGVVFRELEEIGIMSPDSGFADSRRNVGAVEELAEVATRTYEDVI
jgi:hypothetical protein